ncbi:hypothetical protein [Kineosporia babensis]|uniref:Uncharacterized protein n=1 Tax=Kineosporia babensis TaxID=499548 RepID=A0A9X1SRZ5_9ACTN|nr:hypothetical protein [Kineosporia babensis]MCD5309731.1 hypothetical protein [Kineosporia babensis]
MKRVAVPVALVLALLVGIGAVFYFRDEPETVPQQQAVTGDLTVGEATERFLSAEAVRPEPVASSSGVIYARPATGGSDFEAPGTLEILAVDVSETSTHVRFAMSAQTELKLDLGGYVENTQHGFNTVRLIAEQADLSMSGARWTGAKDLGSDCTCGRRPEVIDDRGVQVSLLFPVLPENVTEIQLKVPGFVPLTAPVNRVGAP